MNAGVPRAVIVLSGNELLDGRTPDVNGVTLSAELSARGVKVNSLVIVADDPERLAAALRFGLTAEPDLLVIGGGLGATHDDLTAQCLAETLGVGLEEHPEALAMLVARLRPFAERRHMAYEEMLKASRRQALLPVGATPVPPAGIAPGIAARAGATRIYAFPGVPFEFSAMWATAAEDLAREGFFPDVVARSLRIYGVGELQVAPLLEGVPRDLLELGINVGGGEVVVRVRYPRTPAAEAQAAALIAGVEAGAPVFSRDGRTIDDILSDELVSRAQSVAVAESCTGGLLGARLTERPGSSRYVKGGVISYANEVKAEVLGVPPALLERHGAVSDEVASAMAEGTRRLTGATYGLAVTGVAGPGGGTTEKPVGLVHIACSSPRGTRSTRRVFPGDRATVREYSVSAALHLLRRELA